MLTSHFSRTEWWIAAIVAGLALAVAIQSLVPARKDKWKAVLPPVGAAVFVVLSTRTSPDDGENTALMLFTAMALGLSITRVIFTRYIGRQLELVRSGQPMESPTSRQTAVFLLTFAAVVAAIVATL
ncbi:hypothetical protein [Streptomyces turgidiscabies]|uniref:DUF1453 domain-containing protein n=1 Tax=Streptomyces turgidiscabies TaxID=85558 RepID=A0ABU0RDR9_9ACTN|nr:hypothetical protein [Streptomyces turgidiscabies]MDQ0930126.1 hypothetical protein [Streptomyces turgidiscabies]